MHRYSTQQSANKCSRFCAANVRDREYYEKHGHCQDEAPVTGCFTCKDQQQRAEDRRKREEWR